MIRNKIVVLYTDTKHKPLFKKNEVLDYHLINTKYSDWGGNMQGLCYNGVIVCDNGVEQEAIDHAYSRVGYERVKEANSFSKPLIRLVSADDKVERSLEVGTKPLISLVYEVCRRRDDETLN